MPSAVSNLAPHNLLENIIRSTNAMRVLRNLLPFYLMLAIAIAPLSTFAQEEQRAEKAAVEKAKQDQAKKASEKPQAAPKQDEPRRPADPMSSPTFAGLKFRLVGPAFTSGRVVSIAVDPTDRSRYYVAAASGGVWKTTNAGTTWTPVFDNEGSYSIGTITLDPKNPLTVWVERDRAD